MAARAIMPGPPLKVGGPVDDGRGMPALRSPGGGSGAIVLSVPGSRRSRPSRRRASGLVDQLGRGTAPLHDRVEGRLELPGALRDRAHYRALLAAMLRAWDSVEMTLATSMAHEALGVAPLVRSALLRDDLHRLGGRDDSPRRPGAVMGEAEGVGTIYVLEGAALGGPVLAPLIERHLDLEPGAGTSFFRGLGPRPAQRWSEVRRTVDAWGAGRTGAEVDRAVWAAQLTFAIIGGATAGALADDDAG